MLQMVMSMMVVNCICVGDFLDYSKATTTTTTILQEGTVHNDDDGEEDSKKLQTRHGKKKAVSEPPPPSSSLLSSEIEKTVLSYTGFCLCAVRNLIDTCVRPSGGRGASNIENIKPFIDQQLKMPEGDEVAKFEEWAHHVIFVIEIVRVVACCTFVVWTQYFLGLSAPTWLWGLVRSGMGIVESESESDIRGKRIRFALMLTVQMVTLMSLWIAGAPWSTLATSLVCLLPPYVLGERLFEYIHERVETAQTIIEYERVANFKTKLLSQISHELRSPLMSIIAVTEMAMNNMDCTDEERKENGSIIMSCSTELLAMINDILEFGRLEGKKALLNIKPIDLRMMMQDLRTVMNTVLKSATNKGIDFHVKISDNVPRIIESDEVKLHQICRNLIGNAIKFTDDGEVTVEIDMITPSEIVRLYTRDRPKYDACFLPKTTEESISHELGIFAAVGGPSKRTNRSQILNPLEMRKNSPCIILPKLNESSINDLREVEEALKEDDRKLLVVSVTDSGIGIEDKDFIHLFMPFSQSDDSITRRYGGTGLGLSIIREIVNLMGGFILAFSTHGHGSKFIAAVPIIGCEKESDIPVDCKPSIGTEFSDSIVTATGAYSRASSKIGNEGMGAFPRSRVVSSQHNAKRFGHLRCLVVDDQVLNRKIFGRLLINLGFTEELIEYAEDGGQACDLFVKRQQEGQMFQLCLLDMMMPNVDGFTVLRTIRQYESENGSGHCIVIMVSANVIEIEKSEQHGADSYLAKPFTTAMLKEKLEQLIPE